MYDQTNKVASGAIQGSLGGNLIGIKQLTLSESIDSQIADLQARIDSLKATKEKLSQPGGILNIPINDLRMAMNY